MTDLRRTYAEQGYILKRSFFERREVEAIRLDAKDVFLRQMRPMGFIDGDHPSEREFEAGMARFFLENPSAFMNAGKVCQHLISLHRLSLANKLIRQLQDLGMEAPVICTRPVLYFNTRKLARTEAYYKTPPHQDWRSMQGSLNAMVVWIPLVDIDEQLGALRVIPGSHLGGLCESQPDEWYRHIEDASDADFLSVEVRAGDALFFSAFLVHASGDNVTDAIRWSCHFRYNDLAETTYVARNYPSPYVYKPQQELITPGFPEPELVRRAFVESEYAVATAMLDPS
ncbi:MAG: phytanoyl-CoA dioxygenase family protein [Isosphaeraceae bacterium]